MIDIKQLRKDAETFRKRLKRKRYASELFDRVVDRDKEWRRLLAETDELKNIQKKQSKEIPHVSGDARKVLLEELKEISAQVARQSGRVRELEEELQGLLIHIPNPPLDDVPDGEGEEDNVILRQVGVPRRFDFPIRDHLELGQEHGWINVDRAGQVSGTRFAYLIGGAAMIELALVRMAFTILLKRGFLPVIPPVIVRERAMFGTGFFPAEKFEIYKLENEPQFLIGTSEVPLAGLHMDDILPPEKLPLRYAGFSTCFRREAGAHGRDTRGIFRVHQFDKVEMFAFTAPDESESEHDNLVSIEEEILRKLELPYRVVHVCTGELGASAARKYDLEAWFPGQQRYRELTSCSNCTDYQARRLNIRMRTAHRNTPVHTLNGTAIAIGRTLISLMENHQQEDGSIRIPEALRVHLVPGWENFPGFAAE